MKHIFPIALFALASITAHAQKGRISIDQDPKIDRLLALYKTANMDAEYYKIQVGFGSYDTAQKIKQNVDQDFPLMPVSIDFDSPTYRVRLGRFRSKLDAERELIEVRKKYPEAMLLKPKKST